MGWTQESSTSYANKKMKHYKKEYCKYHEMAFMQNLTLSIALVGKDDNLTNAVKVMQGTVKDTTMRVEHALVSLQS